MTAYVTIGDIMYYEKNNIKIYYEIYGKENKKEIIILPGWGNTRLTFTKMIEKLQKDYKIYILDYPGFGSSPFPNKDLNIYDYANIIKEFIKDNLKVKPSLICHSFGGRIAIILKGLYKVPIDKLILIDIAGIRRKSIKRTLRVLIYKLRKKLVYLKKNKVKYLINLRKKYSSNDYNNLQKNMYITFKNIVNENLKKYIKNINSKTLILWGEKDMDTPLKDGYYLKRKIKDSKLITYKEGNHFVYITEKDVTNKILNFIKKV